MKGVSRFLFSAGLSVFASATTGQFLQAQETPLPPETMTPAPANPAPRPAPNLQPAPPEAFWPQAQQLLQEQSALINRLEQAISGPDPNRVRAVRGQVVLHANAVDRFTRRYYSLPNLLCAPPPEGVSQSDLLAASNSGFSAAQAEVYCTLYSTSRRLVALGPDLDRRLNMLATVAEVKPLEPVSQPYRAIAYGSNRASTGPVSLAQQARPVIATGSNLPPSGPPLLGRKAKQPIADYVPPVAPAIAPPTATLATLRSAQTLVARAQNNFPDSIRPVSLRQSANRPAFPEAQLYAALLQQPDTGTALLYPFQFYQLPPGQLTNRLAPTPAERYPFAPLPAQSSQFTPRLAIRVNQGSFELAPTGLDYGFMTNLGNVPLESLAADSPDRLSLPKPAFQVFTTYRPPNRLQELQTDQRRFITGKGESLPLVSQAPVALNQTYLVRSIQFQVPEVIASGRTIEPRERRNLDQLLEMPSADLLVAFRPINRRPDGSYVVVWRVLKRFPNPQVTDLDRYVQF